MKKVLAILVLVLCLSGTSFAQTQKKNTRQFLGTFGAWSAYKMKENGADLCYMVSEPTKSEGKYKRRGDIFLIIANRPADKTFNVMSLTAGYTYKKGSTATIQVDKNTPMDLFTSDDTAWTNTAKTDAAITNPSAKTLIVFISLLLFLIFNYFLSKCLSHSFMFSLSYLPIIVVLSFFRKLPIISNSL